MRILGAILAGGKSSRMDNRDKAFIALGGASLIERVASRIRFQVDATVISAKDDAAHFARLHLPVVADQLETATPLAGLHAALHYARAENYDAVLTVPCDTPFLPLDLVKRLEEAGRATGAAVAASMARVHYLTGLWSTALAPVIDECIRKDNMRRVQDFVQILHTAEVEWDITPHDPFLNINTPEDLAFAELVLKG